MHPLTGLDHMLAMLAVGLVAAQRGGAALWLWPAGFVAAMLAGYGLGVGLPGSPLFEPGVLASVIILGALATAQARVPLALGVRTDRRVRPVPRLCPRRGKSGGRWPGVSARLRPGHAPACTRPA